MVVSVSEWLLRKSACLLRARSIANCYLNLFFDNCLLFPPSHPPSHPPPQQEDWNNSSGGGSPLAIVSGSSRESNYGRGGLNPPDLTSSTTATFRRQADRILARSVLCSRRNAADIEPTIVY